MRTLMMAALAVLIGLTLPSRGDAAAPLADPVPGDAVLYLGWAGTDALSAKYDASHLKKIVDASDLSEFFNDFLPKLIARVSKDDQNIADSLTQVVSVGKPMWKHPTALYFGGLDFGGPQPVPHLALLCDAGDDAPALVEQITKLLDQLPRDQGPLPLVRQYGSLVVVAFGSPAGIDADFAQPPVQSIAKSEKFTACLKQVQTDPAYIEYVDVDGAVKTIDGVIQRMNDPHTTERWQQARTALGLDGLHEGIVTGGFDGADWLTEGFMSTGEGNQGLLSLFHPTPLSKEILSAIPRSADRLAAGKFDLDALVGNVRNIVAQIDPSTGQQFDDALAQANQSAGIDIRKDFLANLGDEWAVYSDRNIAGPGVLGVVVVNRLKNADAFDTALNQIVTTANKMIADAMQQPNFKLEFHDTVVKGITLHYLAVPLVTPCWAVKDGNLYMGLYPQVVSGAVEQVSSHAPSILQRPEYLALMKRLGDQDPCSVEFSDLPATAPEDYGDLLMITRLYLGYADLYGVHPPAIIVPPLAKIMPELSPSGGVVWIDAAGLHEKSVCPFPGSELISMANKQAGGIAARGLSVAAGDFAGQAVAK